MLTSEDFSDILWEILFQSQGDPKKLEAVLSNLDKEAVADFFNEFVRASGNLSAQVPPHLLAASDDAKDDILDFVVAQGADVYDAMVRNPVQLPHSVDSNANWVKGVTLGVYWDRFGERIPRYHLKS